jgi:hypothetical protein
MKPRDDISKLFGKLNRKASAQLDARIDSEISKALEKSEKKTAAAMQPNVWRIIMKSRISKLAAAAVIVFAVCFGILSRPGSGVAYALSDLPALFREAKTIHIFGHKHVPQGADSNSQKTRAEFEAWLDIENARVHSKFPSNITGDERSVTFYQEFITDGQQTLQINHSDKEATLATLTPEHRELIVSANLDGMLKQMFGNPEEVEAYKLIGEEDIGDTTFHIWQGQVVPDSNEPVELRIKMWVSPETARIAKLRVWQRTAGTNWLPQYEISKIERNIDIPEATFRLHIPEGYSVTEPQEAERRLMSMASWYCRRAGLEICPRLILEDGSMVMPWRSFVRRFTGDVKGPNDPEVFAALEPGGPLPKLPVEVYGLKTKNLFGNGNTFLAGHLFCTRKDGKTYEWAIYVSKSKASNRVSPLGYKPMLRYTLEDVEAEWTKHGWNKLTLHGGISVTRENFDGVFLKALAELSNDGTAVENLTYDWILQVAEQIRRSLAE